MDELLRGLQAGRPEAFDRLVREFGDRVYRFVRRLAGPRWADDLTQEVFIRVFKAIGTYRAGGRFDSWLFTIANHLVIDQVRKRGETAFSELGAVPARAAEGREPLEDLEDREQRAMILKAVDQLPVDQRQVFLLREEAGLSFKEIAEVTGVPLNTALGRMHYAMESLRKAMKSHEVS